MRTLLLCHGEKYSFYEYPIKYSNGVIQNPLPCWTAGIPLSLEILRNADTLDIDKKQAKPIILQDITKPLRKELREKYANTYDIITTLCCGWGLFVKPNGDSIQTAWDNVYGMLKTGGYFILPRPPVMPLDIFPFQEVSKNKKTRLLKKWNQIDKKQDIWKDLSIFIKLPNV